MLVGLIEEHTVAQMPQELKAPLVININMES